MAGRTQQQSLGGGEETRYNLPFPIRDFVFDMHDAVMRSKFADDVQSLYELKFKEITEKFFHNSRWPAAQFVKDEVGGDDFFLLFYRSGDSNTIIILVQWETLT